VKIGDKQGLGGAEAAYPRAKLHDFYKFYDFKTRLFLTRFLWGRQATPIDERPKIAYNEDGCRNNL
jgi:hypothetical protein